jgi:hypothetical protein
MSRITVLLLSFLMSASISFAQIREVPKPVREAFANQYPKATQTTFEDQLTSISVRFQQDSVHMIARYTNKGVWKETEEAFTYDRLPDSVKDGFLKSKYAEQKVLETALVVQPGDLKRYRLKIGNGEFSKRYLYFEPGGRMIRDVIAL